MNPKRPRHCSCRDIFEEPCGSQKTGTKCMIFLIARGRKTGKLHKWIGESRASKFGSFFVGRDGERCVLMKSRKKA